MRGLKMGFEALTVNDLIAELEGIRDAGVFNGLGERVLDGDSRVLMINHNATDDYWITPVQIVDYDCFQEGGPWIVELKQADYYSLEDTEALSNWLDREE